MEGEPLNLEAHDAVAMAELVEKGAVSPEELADAAIATIDKYNPRLNAVVHTMYEQGKEQIRAGLPHGPFRGVPFLIKDLEPEYAGVPLSMGSQSMQDYLPKTDNELVRRFKAAGLVILGKTNTPEFGLAGTTESDFLGAARNPWNPAHTSGGSSGGSAAAVAAGMVPMASGGDAGGSIRIPASCCGLFGLKPSRGRTPLGPTFGEYWLGAATTHGLTRSVRDSALLLDVLTGPDPGAPYAVAPPGRPYREEVDQEPGTLKIAFSTRSPYGDPVHAECVQAVVKTAEMLSELGHEVEEREPELQGPMLAKAFAMLLFGEVDAMIRYCQKLRGKPIRRKEIEPLTWSLRLIGKASSAGKFVYCRYAWNDAARSLGRFFQDVDLWMTPSIAQPPVRIGELMPVGLERAVLNLVNSLGMGSLFIKTGIFEKIFIRHLGKTPFTQVANLTGVPAMSVPLHHHANGLPLGIHFSAAMGREDVLFRLAAQLERAFPWRDRHPQPCQTRCSEEIDTASSLAAAATEAKADTPRAN